jgi:DNA-binding winged helix-turn-helix (wHTH) protein
MEVHNSGYGYEFGHFRLNQAERILLCEGQPMPITARALDILSLLVERHGHIVEKEEILRAVWPDAFVEESNLNVHIFALRKALGEDDAHRYIETVPRRGFRFVADVREWKEGGDRPEEKSLPGAASRLEPVGGAVPLDSPFYVTRVTDEEFRTAVARGDSIVLVKGARQVGKTSLLARSLRDARAAGAIVILSDLQLLNASHLSSAETLFLTLAKSIAEQLELAVSPSEGWDAELSPSMNFTRFVRRKVLSRNEAQLVWGLDEVDRLFPCAFGSEVFGLFRSWHNARALDPAGPWRRLTLALAYATEAHLFITDIHQSPFNVGTRLTLEDFTLEQVATLNRCYGSPLNSEQEVARYFNLVGGHPYLVRCGLHALVTHNSSLDILEAHAYHDEGMFGDHLRRLLITLTSDAALAEVVRGLLQGRPCPTAESFYRLRTAGVIVGEAPAQAKLRCRLYTDYLKTHLSVDK